MAFCLYHLNEYIHLITWQILHTAHMLFKHPE